MKYVPQHELIVATTKDQVSITTDDDETIICSGRWWVVLHNIATEVLDCCMDEAEAGEVEEVARLIRGRVNQIAEVICEQRNVR